jgi:steroid delta-isomerase-like uncharacterized protein
MSAENKAVVRRWFEEVWNQGNDSVVDELMAPGAVLYGLGPEMRGPAAFKPFHAAYRNAFPDVRIEVEDVIAEGDMVALRWTATATHRGDGLGIPATNQKVRFSGMGMARIQGGQLVEGFNLYDEMGLMKQLGVVKA